MSADEAPVDLAVVQADDALLDLFGGCTEREFEAWLRRADAAFLVSLRAGLDPGAVLRGIRRRERSLFRALRSWRRDVEAEPVGELVGTDTAVAAIGAAARRLAMPEPRRSWLGPVAAVLAVLVIAVAGVGLAAKNARSRGTCSTRCTSFSTRWMVRSEY